MFKLFVQNFIKIILSTIIVILAILLICAGLAALITWLKWWLLIIGVLIIFGLIAYPVTIADYKFKKDTLTHAFWQDYHNYHYAMEDDRKEDAEKYAEHMLEIIARYRHDFGDKDGVVEKFQKRYNAAIELWNEGEK